MKELKNHCLQPVNKNFCDYLNSTVQEGNWPKVIDRFWTIDFRHKNKKGLIKAFQVNLTVKEILTQFVEITLDDILAFFHE
jgi:hypothetical protein